MMRKLGLSFVFFVLAIGCLLFLDKKYRQEESILYKVSNGEDVLTAIQSFQSIIPILPNDTDITQAEDSELKTKLSTDRYYAYAHLNEEEQQLYRRIYNLVIEHEHDKEIKVMQEDSIEKVWNCVLYDNPEFFYVSGFTTVEYSNNLGKLDGIGFLVNYTMSDEEIAEHQKNIELVTNEIIFNSPTTDDYEKIKYLYDYLIQTTEYDEEAYAKHLLNENIDTAFNVVSVFEDHVTVCTGYAKAFQYLCNQMNIPCTFISGTANNNIVNEGHAWNLVKADGDWYFVDVTWGDSSFQSTSGLDMDDTYTNYSYLLVPSEDIDKTHTTEMPYNIEVCTTLKDNYYVKEGLYLTELDDAVLQKIFTTNDSIITIKCASLDICQQVKQYLIDENNIYTYAPQTKGYMYNESMNEIMFIL